MIIFALPIFTSSLNPTGIGSVKFFDIFLFSFVPNIPHCVFFLILPIGSSSFVKIPFNSPGDPFSPFLKLIIDASSNSPDFTVNLVFVSPSVIT